MEPELAQNLTAELTRNQPYSSSDTNFQALYKTTFYNKWRCMKYTCKRQHKERPDYSLVYCKRWEYFKNFYEDMYESYSDGFFLWRYDVTKPFSLENCYWNKYREGLHFKRKEVKPMTTEELEAKALRKKIQDVWHSITARVKASKGRLSVCDRWLDFNQFFNDVTGEYAKNKRFVKSALSRVFSPETCKWKDSSGYGNAFIPVNGERVSLFRAAKVLNTSYCKLSHRQKTGKEVINEEEFKKLSEFMEKKADILNNFAGSTCEGCKKLDECSEAIGSYENLYNAATLYSQFCNEKREETHGE